ncbi:tRNA (5-methylaminomethyl-2-thiouridine)(34)-methyltransferase MnmD [Flavobacterium silvaticum]|uniref:tRNA (5-methylaminomethyl-2-thiouridine)(34)-methyltransferase MnmD n=1 Tax=Flavobacterium silvaticum TaxID=1852020 RepID=A0A972JIK2_9FLAO|nr:tRNA (5-methylaminomethyl-2-thiouridine)(34)-methyltransferase MnmD [Flavobacterium silvaticum]NMH27327.1 tRNA (5-methylaminomethyl-2-thiouridine)(34)-methyltransferase MnmD [Flavobacterium silvaticum]
MKREVITTADGSVTLRLPDWDETYHSKHGAIQEAVHVFISKGLDLFQGKPVSILEIGFGTGLNCFLTYLHTKDWNVPIDYTGIEAYPVLESEATSLNYPELVGNGQYERQFQLMHVSDWEKSVDISDTFKLTKLQMKFEDIHLKEQFDLIYFDAFGFRVQPELWSESIFQTMSEALKKDGVLVTYAARSVIRRNLKATGFSVETLPGPPGKREMTRAVKL